MFLGHGCTVISHSNAYQNTKPKRAKQKPISAFKIEILRTHSQDKCKRRFHMFRSSLHLGERLTKDPRKTCQGTLSQLDLSFWKNMTLNRRRKEVQVNGSRKSCARVLCSNNMVFDDICICTVLYSICSIMSVCFLCLIDDHKSKRLKKRHFPVGIYRFTKLALLLREAALWCIRPFHIRDMRRSLLPSGSKASMPTLIHCFNPDIIYLQAQHIQNHKNHNHNYCSQASSMPYHASSDLIWLNDMSQYVSQCHKPTNRKWRFPEGVSIVFSELFAFAFEAHLHCFFRCRWSHFEEKRRGLFQGDINVR